MKETAVTLLTEREAVEKSKHLRDLKALTRGVYTSWYECHEPEGELWPIPCQFIEFKPVVVCTTLLLALKRLNETALLRPSSKKSCHSISKFSFTVQGSRI